MSTFLHWFFLWIVSGFDCFLLWVLLYGGQFRKLISREETLLARWLAFQGVLR